MLSVAINTGSRALLEPKNAPDPGDTEHGFSAACEARYHPDRYFSAKLWSDYQAYKQAVIKAAPSGLSLRDKDRYLNRRPYRKAVETDCRG